MSNYYNKLDVNEDMDISRKKEVRKAKKILNSINELKTNKNLNDDQKAKINTEHMWHKVLDPSYKSAEEKQELEKENQREAAIKNKKREKKLTDAAIKNEIQKKEQIAKNVKLQKKLDETKVHRAQLEKELDEIKARDKEKEEVRRKKKEVRRKKEEEEERKKTEEEEEKERKKEEKERKKEEKEERKKKREEPQRKKKKGVKLTDEESMIYTLAIEFELLTDEKGLTENRAKKKLLLKYHPDKNRQMSEERATIMTQLINELF